MEVCTLAALFRDKKDAHSEPKYDRRSQCDELSGKLEKVSSKCERWEGGSLQIYSNGRVALHKALRETYLLAKQVLHYLKTFSAEALQMSDPVEINRLMRLWDNCMWPLAMMIPEVSSTLGQGLQLEKEKPATLVMNEHITLERDMFCGFKWSPKLVQDWGITKRAGPCSANEPGDRMSDDQAYQWRRSCPASLSDTSSPGTWRSGEYQESEPPQSRGGSGVSDLPAASSDAYEFPAAGPTTPIGTLVSISSVLGQRIKRKRGPNCNSSDAGVADEQTQVPVKKRRGSLSPSSAEEVISGRQGIASGSQPACAVSVAESVSGDPKNLSKDPVRQGKAGNGAARTPLPTRSKRV